MLDDLASIRVVRCHVGPVVGRQRMASWAPRPAHADSSVSEDAEYYAKYVPVSLGVPTIDVDTSNAYEPTLDEIVAFVKGA